MWVDSRAARRRRALEYLIYMLRALSLTTARPGDGIPLGSLSRLARRQAEE